MCARFLVAGERVALDLFDLDEPVLTEPSVAPTDSASIARPSDEGIRIEEASWGLRPTWTKRPLINAKAETVLTQAAFRDGFAQNRCLVPATSFFEWETTAEGKKLPYCFAMKDDAPFAMAGFCVREEGQLRFCILTTSPNELVGRIHDRMPAIIPRNSFENYLRGAAADARGAALVSLSAAAMKSERCIVPPTQRRSIQPGLL